MFISAESTNFSNRDSNAYMEIPFGGLVSLRDAAKNGEVYLNMQGNSPSSPNKPLVRQSP